MSNPDSKTLLILDRIVDVLVEDGALHPDRWFVLPRTVTRTLRASVQDAERPLVALEFGKSDPIDGGVSDGGTIYREMMELTAWLEVDGADDPQAAGLRLASDFRRFLGRHRQLEDDAGVPFVDCGQVHDRGFAMAVDFDAASGGALAEFRVAVEYYWTATDG